MQKEKTTERMLGFDPRPIFENAPGFQDGEGELIVGGDSKQVLGRMTACFLSLHDPEGRPCFKGITIIAPPRLVRDFSEDDIQKMLEKGIEDMRGGPLASEEASRILAQVAVHRCERLDVNDIATVIEAAGERRIVLVPDCSKYRDPQLNAEWALGRSGTLLPEDIWVQHTARLAVACLAAAKPRGSVVVLSATEELPVRDSNIKLLNDVEDLYPILVEYEGQPEMGELLSKSVPRWVALAAGGRSQQAFAELDLTVLEDGVKRQILLQVAARAGDREKTLGLLREFLANVNKLPGETAARMGRMAYTFGDAEAAREFFAAGLDQVSEQQSLEVILISVTSMGATDLVERCWNRLRTLFPESKILEEDREFRLLKICETAAAPAPIVPSRVGFEEFHDYVADVLHLKRDVDYEALLEQVRLRWADKIQLAAICMILHGLELQKFEAVIAFAPMAADDPRYEPQVVRVLLGALRRMFLLEVLSADGMEMYKIPLGFILRYLGSNPDQASLRAALGSALSVETAGRVGLPVLASFALDVTAALGAQLEKSTPTAVEPADPEVLKAFFARTIAWMAEQAVIELGVTRLPAELAGDNAGGLIAALEVMMRHAARNHDTTEDLLMLEKCAYMVCLLHPYAPEGQADLDALRLLAAKFSLQGQPQRARDMAEQILLLAGESRQRQRLAWGNYADIYQRTRSPVDALIGLTCAAFTEAELSAADIFQEAYTLVRVTRDLHLYDVARAILPACRRLYEIQGLGTLGQQRLDGIEIALDVAESIKLDEAGLLALLQRAHAHCAEVMKGQDELFPAAAQFLQIAGGIERSGVKLPSDALALRTAVNERLGPETAAFLRTVSAAVPSVQDVVWLHNRLAAARYSEDIAGDLLTVVIAAHRLLLPRTPDVGAEEATVAMELLSDRAVELAGPAQQLDLQWPAEFIIELSLAGLGVLMLAVDSDGELLAVVAEKGLVRVERLPAKDHTFERRVIAWSVKYPYRYGLIEREEGNGEFYASMQGLEFPMPNTENVLVVAQPALQELAFNLVLADGEFVGRSKAIGIAPSLSWLNSARQRPAATSDKRLAWISCLPQAEGFGTLDMLFARLAPLFDEHGFRTDTSGHIPNDLRGARMAIITAHGQLTNEQRYIHSIADEQDLNESPQVLARALAGVELVILFVCSGGRVDRHPIANTTVSLPKMLLNYGCRAVIASPWPLAAAVPGNWLECFLEAWEVGTTVLEANFKANRHVQERLGPEPGLGLAMTVYGDVLLTK